MNSKRICILVVLNLLLIACLCSSPFSFNPEPAATRWVSVTQPGTTSTSIPLESIPGSGSLGLGDQFYPYLGNGGYDTQHYTITLVVDPGYGSVDGWTTIEAVATEDLEAFSLDFYHLDVHSVTINDQEAEFSRQDSELIIYTEATIHTGEVFIVKVVYSGEPTGVPDPALSLGDGIGWLELTSGIYTINEPSGAMGWFPSNNYPTDKAAYTFEITVNKPYVVAANGVLVSVVDNGSTRTYVWEMADPMSTYLASINIGRFELRTDTSSSGVPIRNYFATGVSQDVIDAFDALPEMIDYYSELIAPYPFEEYGVVVMPEFVGVAMENQSLSVFGSDMAFEEAVAHELAHQWFGDSVTLSNWPDIWLNEGFATYMEALWMEHTSGTAAYNGYIDSMYEYGVSMMSPGDVPNSRMFDWAVYQRGALVLHALRKTVGDDTFFTVLRTYYDRFQYNTASTEDFIAVAEEVSNRELASFFDDWLYNDQIPPLP